MDKEAFISGVLAKANELNLTADLRNKLLKVAGVFSTSDSITSALGNDPTVPGLIGHNVTHGLPHAAIGAALGAPIANSLMSGDNTKRKNYIGAALGGSLGLGAGMFNDFAQLGENELDLRSKNLIERALNNNSSSEEHQQTLEALQRTLQDSWKGVYGLSNN